MKEIHYITGDATNPKVQGNKIICHICNDIGAWGAGFVLALSRKWQEPEKSYRKWFVEKAENGRLPLGRVKLVQVEPDVFVANMIGQCGIGSTATTKPIRYEAVQQCLTAIAIKAKEINASVHMPRIGCGLAGGEWQEIEEIINKTLLKENLEVFVYDLKK